MTEQYIPIITGKASTKVKVSDVVMIERYGRKLHVITDEKEYDYYEHIENVAPFLDSKFYPCLKGCYINLDKVTSMSDLTITFDNGTVFNLGRDNFIRAKQTYSTYLKRRFSNCTQLQNDLR